MNRENVPTVAGVNLPSAHKEAAQLIAWAAHHFGNPWSLLLLFTPDPGFVLLRPTPNSHGLALVVVRTDESGLDVESETMNWLDDLTLRGYRTAVCNGYLAARACIENYLKS